MRENSVCTAADAIYKLAAGNLKYLNARTGAAIFPAVSGCPHGPRASRPMPSSLPAQTPGSSRRTFSRRASGSCSSFGWRATSSTTTSWAASSTRQVIWAVGWWWCWAIPTAARWMRPSTTSRRLYPLHHGRDQEGHRGGDQPYKASCLNVRHSVQEIEKSLCIHDIGRKRACGSSVRCITSRTAASNFCNHRSIAAKKALFHGGKGPFPLFDNPASFAYTDSGKRNRRRDGIWYR